MVFGSPAIYLNSLVLLLAGIAAREKGLLLLAAMSPLVINQPGSTSLIPLFLIFQIGLAVGFLWSRRPPLHQRPLPGTLKFFLLLYLLAWIMALVAPGAMLARFPGDAIMHRFRWIIFGTFMHFATTLYFPFLLTFQLVVLLVIAWGVWRYADLLTLVRWYRLTGLTILVLAVLGLLDYIGSTSEPRWFDLFWFRRYNLYIERVGYRRLMSLAGHSGWLAEYMVLFFPGLWLGVGARVRSHLFAVVATAVTAVAMILTFQRAGWISFAAVLGMCVYFFFSESRRENSHVRLVSLVPGIRWATLPVILAGGIAAAGATALVLKGPLILQRLSEIVELGDRLNYFVTGAHMLMRAPMGVGLGLHGLIYVSQFLPYSRWYMLDNLTAHNTWLTVLTEQGLFATTALIGIFVILLSTLRHIRREPDSHRRWYGLMFWTGLAGMTIYSFFQYLFFIRVIEIGLWLVGLTLVREFGPQGGRTLKGWQGLLAAAAAVELIALPFNHYMRFPNRGWQGSKEAGWEVWTAESIEVAVDDDATRVSFNLYSKVPDQTVKINYPDGSSETVMLGAEDFRPVVRDLSGAGNFPGPFNLLTMEVSRIGIGDELMPVKPDGSQNDDRRKLGVYISNFRYDSSKAEQQRFRSSSVNQAPDRSINSAGAGDAARYSQ
ncbi:MAG: hypothetical protein Kow0059_04350 [Candidatus Sumerlaeia bacterium]